MQMPVLAVPSGCSPCVAAAVRDFSEKWAPYSVRSRKHSIFGLFKREIEPAWTRYVAQLPAALRSRAFTENILLGCAGADRFEVFRNRIHQACRDLTFGRSLAKLNEVESTLLATLEALSEVAIQCRLKQPAKLRDERHKLNARRRANPLCEFCGCPTELEALLQGRSSLEGDLDEMAGVSLSGKYCTMHRARLADGSSNPLYQQARRRAKQFNEELSRLQRQNVRLSTLRANSGNHDVDRFILKVIERTAYVTGEDAGLRNQAHRLALKKISDRKKRIVMLSGSGIKQCEIAKGLGIGPQAVSSSIRKIEREYRFDLVDEHEAPTSVQMWISKMRIDVNCGELIVALRDTDVTEVMLNDDGGLWVDRRSIGLHKVGAMSARSAAEFVSAVARSLAILGTSKNPIIEGELPFGMFVGFLPPIVDNASFTIRKRK